MTNLSLRIGAVWPRVGIALGLALLLVPVGRVAAAVSWTKIVSLNALNLVLLLFR